MGLLGELPYILVASVIVAWIIEYHFDDFFVG